MRNRNIKASSINIAARKRFYQGNDKSVLLIHGFTGIPNDMDYLAKQLNQQGYTVSIPRLPGHGTDYNDFRNSSWKQWLRHVYDEYLELESQSSSVYVVGLSMGGLLATLVSSIFKPEKLVLAAPAFMVKNSLLPLTPIIGILIPRYRNKKRISDVTDPVLLPLEKEYWEWNQVWGAGQLFKLQKMAKLQLNNLTSSTLLIISKNDNTIPYEIKNYLESRIDNLKIKSLTNSGHVVVNDCDKEDVAREIINWFGQKN